jgi:hypothetical protein
VTAPADPVLLNILVAYPYMDADSVALLVEHRDACRFLLDSGAFTAWKAGKTINVDDYCRFLDACPAKPWRYFTLDVVGDPHGTMKNYKTMLDRGFKPVPIFTRGEDLSVLEDYYKTSDVVGVGGLVGTYKNKGFLRALMARVGKRKIHWLGFTNMDFVKYYKPYMCDSSNWNAAARYATVSIYDGRGGTVATSKAEFSSRPSKVIADLVMRYDVSPSDLAVNQNWSGRESPSRTLAARSAVTMSVDVQIKLGTYMFLATTMAHYIIQLVHAFHWNRRRFA